MGTISYHRLQGRKHIIDQYQTNGLGTISYQWTQARNYQCQTNGHNLQLICLEQGLDYSLAVIKAKSLYQLTIFGFYIKVLTDVITS